MILGLSRNALAYCSAAEIIVQLTLTKENIPKILNIAGDKALTKYQLGLMIAADIRVPSSLVRPITQEEAQKFFLEQRASAILLDNSLLKRNINP